MFPSQKIIHTNLGQEENFDCDKYVYGIDRVDGFMGIYCIYIQNHQVVYMNM